jgi:RNA polymerase sigma factor (sigma-70 family)
VVSVAFGADAEVIWASRTDASSFAALYDRYAEQLYRYAYQRAGEQTAEDVVADTFLAAFQQRGSYDLDREDARPWLFGILTRQLARHYRAENARLRAFARVAGDGVEESPAERIAEQVSATAMRAPLARALGALSKRDRDVLLLIAWAECSYEEVALALGIPIGTVRSRLNRARRKVKDSLGGAE